MAVLSDICDVHTRALVAAAFLSLGVRAWQGQAHTHAGMCSISTRAAGAYGNTSGASSATRCLPHAHHTLCTKGDMFVNQTLVVGGRLGASLLL